jgi:hypothetical protein
MRFIVYFKKWNRFFVNLNENGEKADLIHFAHHFNVKIID